MGWFGPRRQGPGLRHCGFSPEYARGKCAATLDVDTGVALVKHALRHHVNVRKREILYAEGHPTDDEVLNHKALEFVDLRSMVDVGWYGFRVDMFLYMRRDFSSTGAELRPMAAYEDWSEQGAEEFIRRVTSAPTPPDKDAVWVLAEIGWEEWLIPGKDPWPAGPKEREAAGPVHSRLCLHMLGVTEVRIPRPSTTDGVAWSSSRQATRLWDYFVGRAVAGADQPPVSDALRMLGGRPPKIRYCDEYSGGWEKQRWEEWCKLVASWLPPGK